MNSGFRMKWWGWGAIGQYCKITDRPGIFPYLKQKLGIHTLAPAFHKTLDDIQIPASRMPQEICEKFISILGQDKCLVSKEERVLHSFGKSYQDMLRIRSLQIVEAPDLVIYPESPQDIQNIYKICTQYKIAIVPFGGGTSVVDGVAPKRSEFPYLITLNLSRLNRILKFDPQSLILEVEAGIFGPALEEWLNAQGYTLGHFPQSFEFSTVGGWIATRSSGQNCLLYGGIERLLVALTIETPMGTIHTLKTPRMAVGPEFKEIFLGSEGVLGIVTSAVLKITPAPLCKDYSVFLCKNFAMGAKICQTILQKGIKAAMIRVSDAEETYAMMTMGSRHSQGIHAWIKKAIQFYLKMKKFLPGEMCSIIVGIEGSTDEVHWIKKQIQQVFSRFDSFYAGTAAGEKWLKDRFILPYLREEFMDNGILVDTLETATTWDRLLDLDNVVKQSIYETIKTPVCVYSHISHAYATGASLYFTVLAKQDDSPLEQWQAMKTAANKAIQNFGAPISHHHGIGITHKEYVYWNNLQKQIISQIKKEVDPAGILNPGKLA